MEKGERMGFANEIENSSEKFRERVNVAKRLIKVLGQEYIMSGSYKDKFDNVQLSSSNVSVCVKLGLQNHIRNNGKYPEELFRIYKKAESGEERLQWEDLSYGDKREIIETVYPAVDVVDVLGE